MKNLLFLLCCFFATMSMSSCTADPIESDTPAVHADDFTSPLPPSVPTPPVDHGGGAKDKDKGDN